MACLSPVCYTKYSSKSKRKEENDDGRKDKNAGVAKLQSAKALLKKEVGMFSNFKGTAKPAIISMLAISENADQVLADAVLIYNRLKKTLHASEYMACAAIVASSAAVASTSSN